MLEWKIQEQASQASNLINDNISKTVWRTSMRIHDLIKIQFPSWEENSFLKDRKIFLYFVLRFCFDDILSSVIRNELDQLWERYEESVFEPTLFQDIHTLPSNRINIPQKVKWIIYPYIPIDVRAILSERQMIRYMRKWLDFNRASELTEIMTPYERQNMVFEFIDKWMMRWNIFYKHIVGSKDNATDELPMLPATIN